MPKVTLGITGLPEILGRDYGIEKPYWGPSMQTASGRLFSSQPRAAERKSIIIQIVVRRRDWEWREEKVSFFQFLPSGFSHILRAFAAHPLNVLLIYCDSKAVVDTGEGPGGPGPLPYFQTKLRPKGPKKIFFETPPPPHPPSSEGLDAPLKRAGPEDVWRSGSCLCIK